MAHSACRLQSPFLCQSGVLSVSKPSQASEPLHHSLSLHVDSILQRKSLRGFRLHAVSSTNDSKSRGDKIAEKTTPHPSRPLQYGSRLERLMPEKDFLQKAEDEMTEIINASQKKGQARDKREKCMTLEGDDAYNCWQTVFEFEDEKAAAERECILAPPGEKQQACGPLESLQTLVREGSAQGVSAVLANIQAAAQSKKARRASDAKKAAKGGGLVSGAARKTEADRAEFEVSGGRSGVTMAQGGPPRSESTEEWENVAAQVAAEGMEDRLRRGSSSEEEDDLSAVRRALKKRGLSATWLKADNV